jgi:nicotinate-nucleotide pyrophosphorylase (carboxylating)
MLDNMNAQQIARAVERVCRHDRRTEIEVSGGITLNNLEEIAESGIDYVSIGALTHSAPAIDIAMKIKSLGRSEP